MKREQTKAKWYIAAAKIGLTAKGVVYCLSGAIALTAALDIGNTNTNDAGKKGIFSFLEKQPTGKWLLLVIALGLICYIIWRWIQAVTDTEHKGKKAKGIGKRLSYFWSGMLYAGACVYAFKLFLGGSDKKSGNNSFTHKMLDSVWGEIIFYGIGAFMIGTGLFQVYRVVSGKYKKYVQDALHKDSAPWIISAGIAGYIARGIVWMILGWLFIKAAMHSNEKEAGGSNKAFSWLEHSSYGSVLLGTVAAGLICYGLFMFLRARYQRINVG